LHRARAGRAGRAADLFRLLHLARGAERSRSDNRDARDHLSLLHVLPARAAAGHRLPHRRTEQRPAARPPPLQFHLVPGRRRRLPAMTLFMGAGVGAAAPRGEWRGAERGEQPVYWGPPPLVRKDLIAAMRADARAIMPPQFLDCLDNMRPFFTPIYDFSTPQLVYGRVALVGDAASSARPHMGFGMAKAGGDAQALAEALGDHDDIDAALPPYNRIPHPT